MKLRRYLALAFGGILFLNPLLAQKNSNKSSFNSNWKFYLTKENDKLQEESANFYLVDFDDSNWRTLNVPHDWSIEQEFSKENAHENAWLPGGVGWYRKQFKLKQEDKDKHFEIQFDGVYRHAQIWVNEKYVGVQYDGYTSFYFDITSFLKFNEPNTIALRVDNSIQPNCRWYTGSGIFRNVWLRISNPLHVKNWGTAITTPIVTQSEAKVVVNTELEYTGTSWKNCLLETTVYDAEGKQVVQQETKFILGSKQGTEVKQEFSIFSPALWSLDSPTMYTAVSQIKEKGKIIDEYKTRFGIRDIKFDAQTGFYLNGENMKFKGVCLHSSAGVFGIAVPKEVWVRRLEELKAIGCNAIRTAHNSMAPEFMDICDSLGFLVMDEFVDKWDDKTYANPFFHNEWKHNFGEIVRRDRNHPSVVIWSVGNENHNPGTEEQTEGLKNYCNYVRSIDMSRPVVSGMPRPQFGDPEKIVDGIIESSQHMDVIGMNYGEQWVPRIMHRNPGKPFVSTESYTYYSSTENERWCYNECAPWLDVIENDQNMGLFLWSGIKYLGEIPAKGKNSWPKVYCWPAAFLNSAGFRTPTSYFYESLWSNKPMVHIAVYEKDSWFNKKWGVPPANEIWNYKSGKVLDLITYTNCDKVELYLNNKKIGTQYLDDCANRLMKWREIPYAKGQLKAIAYKDGEKASEFVLITAENPNKVQVSFYKNQVNKDGVAQVEIQLLDKKGISVKHQEVELNFEVIGGKIIGLDNGGLTALDNFKATDSRKTYQGKCLVYIQANTNVKEVQLNVSGKQIESNSARISINK
ncbi:glycoside hydrolase family 2 TIM barrel-domain containing protein [Marinifilum sp. RC60d5]|uniref:glycoside hydrolase family 2 TIM barrel-domain containing protein n=1 Tax=Marinifilum sp. RC60d5 TaxID=3458414 RepID=UPI0040350CB0